MSSTKANTGATPTSVTATSLSPTSGGGGMETKVVETVDYRTSAGQGQQERKPVAVVHEYPTGVKDSPSGADPKQD